MGLLMPSRGVWGLGVLWGLGVQTHPGATAGSRIGRCARGHPKGLSPRCHVPQGCTYWQCGVHGGGGGYLGCPRGVAPGSAPCRMGPCPNLPSKR